MNKSNRLVTVKFQKKFRQSLRLFPVLQKLTHMFASLCVLYKRLCLFVCLKYIYKVVAVFVYVLSVNKSDCVFNYVFGCVLSSMHLLDFRLFSSLFVHMFNLLLVCICMCTLQCLVHCLLELGGAVSPWLYMQGFLCQRILRLTPRG